MTAHRMAADGALVINGKTLFDQGRQFINNIVVHAVMLAPGFLSSVHVKTGPQPQVIRAIRCSGNTFSPWTGIGYDKHNAQFRGNSLGAGLDGEILVSASQPR